MYPTRIVLRPSQGHRVARAVPSACRGMSSFFPATSSPFWGPPSRGAALSPLSSPSQDIFRLLDESARALDNYPDWLNAETSQQQQQQQQRIWQPRFDVQENDGAYELRGELPGVEGKDLDVQFTDPTTLVIRGRTETTRTEGQPAKPVDGSAPDASMSGAVADNTAAAPEDAEKTVSDTASVHSDSSYVQPTVEDDVPETASTLAGGANEATPATSTVSAAAPAEDAAKQAASAEQTEQQRPSSHYWLSERRTGSFQRTFTFPTRVDQDNVSASLRNGVLNITVPKAAVPAPRRISVL